MKFKKAAVALALGSALPLAALGAVLGDSIGKSPEVEKSPAYEAAAKLIDGVIADPGFYRQNCGTRWLTQRARFLPYQFYRGEDKISAENYQQLRDQRDAVLQVVIDRLPGVMDAVVADWEARSTAGFRPPHGVVSYEHSHYLAILIDLNGVEALPTLLELLDGLEGDSYTLQRGDTLSTITGILRQERYQPLLDSDMEQAYREQAFHGVGKSTMTPETIEERLRCYYQFDPITGRACSYLSMDARMEVEVTPELEAQIVGWARDFLSTVPAKRRLGAGGMNAWPVVR